MLAAGSADHKAAQVVPPEVSATRLGVGMDDCRGDGEWEGLGAAPAQVGTVLAPPHHFCPLWPVIVVERQTLRVRHRPITARVGLGEGLCSLVRCDYRSDALSINPRLPMNMLSKVPQVASVVLVARCDPCPISTVYVKYLRSSRTLVANVQMGGRAQSRGSSRARLLFFLRLFSDSQSHY